MSKKHRKTTMPALIEKNERNCRRQISRPEKPATISKVTKVTGLLIRSKTRTIVYRQVRTINN